MMKVGLQAVATPGGPFEPGAMMSTVDPRNDDEPARAESQAGALHGTGGDPNPAPAAALTALQLLPPGDDLAASLEYWYFCGGGRDLRDA
jgi:hypothetical protein